MARGKAETDSPGTILSNLLAESREWERWFPPGTTQRVRLDVPGNIFTVLSTTLAATAHMDYQHLIVQRRDGVMLITLNRPEVLNSFNRPMADELVAALGDAASDAAVRAVLLTGSGRGFCAGQDLAAVLPAPGEPAPDLGDVVRHQYNPIIRAIRTLEKPVVCAVNGVAAGAGANLAFACDLVVAAEDATFIQSFARVGLIPDSGGTFILPQIIGLQRAAALTMLGEKLTADRALEWGLIHAVVPHAVIADTSFDLARRLAEMPTRGLGLTKRGFNAAFSNTLDDQLALEDELQREAGRTADHAEGVRAFVEKRAPNFQGR
jgi:2-(1,2-epoxy-1,2-dihydrophenyl)acetyl-CoA isomerase